MPDRAQDSLPLHQTAKNYLDPNIVRPRSRNPRLSWSRSKLPPVCLEQLSHSSRGCEVTLIAIRGERKREDRCVKHTVGASVNGSLLYTLLSILCVPKAYFFSNSLDP